MKPKKEYIKKNHQFWNRKYEAPNTEGFIFRLKPWVIDKYIDFKKRKVEILDYGCGEGASSYHFLKSYSYIPHGVDISVPSIKACKLKFKKYKNNFKVISPEPSENDNFFNKKFDLIIAVENLYYLDNEDCEKRLISLKKMLKPNGFVFFSIMSTKNEYWKFFSNKKKNKDGLTTVNLGGDKYYKKRQNQPTYKHYINFTKTEKDVEKKFKIFKKLNIGFYDSSLLNLEFSRHHYTFFGKNK